MRSLLIDCKLTIGDTRQRLALLTQLWLEARAISIAKHDACLFWMMGRRSAGDCVNATVIENQVGMCCMKRHRYVIIFPNAILLCIMHRFKIFTSPYTPFCVHPLFRCSACSIPFKIRCPPPQCLPPSLLLIGLAANKAHHVGAGRAAVDHAIEGANLAQVAIHAALQNFDLRGTKVAIRALASALNISLMAR